MDRRIRQGADKLALFGGVLRRSITLVALGLILTGFPNLRLIGPWLLIIGGMSFLYRREPIFTLPTDPVERKWKLVGFVVCATALLWFLLDFGHFNGPNKSSKWIHFFPLSAIDGGFIRVPGVLQRIGVAFLIAAVIMMFTRTRGRIAWVIGILLAYWAILRFIPAPDGYLVGGGGGKADAPVDALFRGHLNDWIDVKLLGQHLYSARPDPEGLLSTLPCIAQVLLGILAGTWLHQARTQWEKFLGMIAAGVVLVLVGLLWDNWFPLNKKLWSSSYVVYTVGCGLIGLAGCYYLNDIRGWRLWSRPFAIFGTNAILVFFGSGLGARIMGMITWQVEGKTVSLKGWIYTSGFESLFDPGKTASAAFAIAYIVLWLAITWPLYRNKIFLKV
jgi:predicted acyltransferase